MRDRLAKPLLVALALTSVLVVLKLALAAHHALLADEAYYWVWSGAPAWGYYDQPPLIAWMIAATTALSHAEWAVRLGAVAAGVVGAVAMVPAARDKPLMLLWWAGAPPLLFLTLFATPDAPLLAAWAVTLAAAHRGRRWWLLAGLAAGVAVLSKYTGLAVLPLAVLAAGPRDWRTPWPWAALGIMGLVVAPHLAWSASHDWVSLGFQLHEGLIHPHAPGALGPVRQVGEQILVLTPLAFAAGAWWLVATARRALGTWSSDDPGVRAVRLAWLTGAPVLGFFALASVFAPPEAHWPAVAWVSVGLGLSHARGRLLDLAWLGAWLGLLLGGAVAVHSLVPLVHLEGDPAHRLMEGPAVAEWSASWACPAGAVIDPVPGAEACEGAAAVVTERYQEASLLRYYTGLPATTFPGCARDSQYDLWERAPLPERLLVLRPATRGGDLCTDALYPEREGPYDLDLRSDAGRRVRRWQLFSAAR